MSKLSHDRLVNPHHYDPTTGKYMKKSEREWWKTNKRRRRKKSGCYIATCVYGSYDCPEVWILRRFRDQKLNRTFLGNIFIEIYYAVSPVVVNLFGNSTCIKNIWRCILDRFVGFLHRKGINDTPYQDEL